MPSLPDPTFLSGQTPSWAQDQFALQGANLPAVAALLQQAADMDNSGFQQGVSAVDPNLTANIGGVDALARQYALGGVDDETRAAIARQGAYNAIQGGYRAPDQDATGGQAPLGMQQAANLVNIGKKSLEEQQQAPALMNQAAQASLALNPTHVDVGSTLISPAALLAREDQRQAYNVNLRNQSKLLNAGSANQSQSQGINALFSGLGGLLGGVQKAGGLSALFGGFG